MSNLTAKQFTDLATPVSLATLNSQAITPEVVLTKFKAYRWHNMPQRMLKLANQSMIMY